jgi:hypothetical protein
MNFRRQLAAFALLGVLAALPACTLPPDAPTVIASATGTGPDDAYRVVSVAQEYEVLRLLGLEMRSQALHVINGQPYDVLTVRDTATGAEREVWFDISRFYGRGDI